MYKELTVSEKFVHDWQYERLGSFNTALAKALSTADSYNFSRLRLGFKDEADGVWNYINTSGWWEAVQEKAQV